MRVLLFLADPLKWPRWPLLKVSSIEPTIGERWQLSTPLGLAGLRIKRNAAVGIFEYILTVNGTQWSVPGRVMKNGIGSELVLTLFRHQALSKDIFELFVSVIDRELVWLKKMLELQ